MVYKLFQYIIECTCTRGSQAVLLLQKRHVTTYRQEDYKNGFFFFLINENLQMVASLTSVYGYVLSVANIESQTKIHSWGD